MLATSANGIAAVGAEARHVGEAAPSTAAAAAAAEHAGRYGLPRCAARFGAVCRTALLAPARALSRKMAGLAAV